MQTRIETSVCSLACACDERDSGNMTLYLFEIGQIWEAFGCSLDGHQALHLMHHTPRIYHGGKVPRCFEKASRFAHLLDQDKQRLRNTTRELGVNIIKVSIRKGSPEYQHTDLCGRPLIKAIHKSVRPTQDQLDTWKDMYRERIGK